MIQQDMCQARMMKEVADHFGEVMGFNNLLDALALADVLTTNTSELLTVYEHVIQHLVHYSFVSSEKFAEDFQECMKQILTSTRSVDPVVNELLKTPMGAATVSIPPGTDADAAAVAG